MSLAPISEAARKVVEAVKHGDFLIAEVRLKPAVEQKKGRGLLLWGQASSAVVSQQKASLSPSGALMQWANKHSAEVSINRDGAEVSRLTASTLTGLRQQIRFVSEVVAVTINAAPAAARDVKSADYGAETVNGFGPQPV